MRTAPLDHWQFWPGPVAARLAAALLAAGLIAPVAPFLALGLAALCLGQAGGGLRLRSRDPQSPYARAPNTKPLGPQWLRYAATACQPLGYVVLAQHFFHQSGAGLTEAFARQPAFAALVCAAALAGLVWGLPAKAWLWAAIRLALVAQLALATALVPLGPLGLSLGALVAADAWSHRLRGPALWLWPGAAWATAGAAILG